MKRVIILSAMLLALAGCVQVETRVKLNPDGSATITERFRISKRLLDLSASADNALAATLLSREAALQRMKQMGEDVELIKYEIKDAEGGARDCVCTYQVADIREFRYVSPFLAADEYVRRNQFRFDLAPVYEDRWWFGGAGEMAVNVRVVGDRQGRGDEQPAAPLPAELQAVRDLQPVFHDMLLGFKFKLTFESYAPLKFGRGYYRWRNSRAHTREYDLIDFSYDDMDNHAQKILENEEVMLELLRGDLGGPNIAENVKEHATNLTLPVFHPSGIPPIVFPPSEELFEREFHDENKKPKMLKFNDRRGPPRPADPVKDVFQDRAVEKGNR